MTLVFTLLVYLWQSQTHPMITSESLSSSITKATTVCKGISTSLLLLKVAFLVPISGVFTAYLGISPSKEWWWSFI